MPTSTTSGGATSRWSDVDGEVLVGLLLVAMGFGGLLTGVAVIVQGGPRIVAVAFVVIGLAFAIGGGYDVRRALHR